MKLVKIKLVFKISDLILFTINHINKRCKQNDMLDVNYRVKISFLVSLHLESVKKLLLTSFLKSTLFILSYGSELHQRLANVILAFNNTHCYTIKFNNNLYSSTIIKSSYFFNYCYVQKLLYKTLANIAKKIAKII